MTARISFQLQPFVLIRLPTASLQITKSRFSRCLTAQVEKDWPARLIVRSVEKVPLLESGLGMRSIPLTLWEVVNLQKKSLVSGEYG
jgi:hypothetical protein